MKQGLTLLIIPLFFLCVYFLFAEERNIKPKRTSTPDLPKEHIESAELLLARLQEKAAVLKTYVATKGFSDRWAFFIDLSMPSGRKRFFIYDLQKDTIIQAGLVSHGHCNSGFQDSAQFSNQPGSGCSSRGRYKVGYHYKGRFGKSYKLFGLDSTNSNAFPRSVVLHAYSCVPDEEIFPDHICNSLGCPMVSNRFMGILENVIDSSPKSILLWIL